MPEEMLPELNWPRWKWELSKTTSTVSFFLGALAYFVPFLTGVQPSVWVSLGITVLSLLIIAPSTVWIYGTALVAYKRASFYPSLHCYAQKQTLRLMDATKALATVLPFHVRFEFLRVLYNPAKREMHIVILKREDIELSEGERLWVTDEEGILLGEFEVTQVLRRDYYARGVSVSPTWLGFVHQEGRLEMMPPPYAKVTLVPRSANHE